MEDQKDRFEAVKVKMVPTPSCMPGAQMGRGWMERLNEVSRSQIHLLVEGVLHPNFKSMNIRTYVDIYVYISVYIYTCIHTYIHICIHIRLHAVYCCINIYLYM